MSNSSDFNTSIRAKLREQRRSLGAEEVQRLSFLVAERLKEYLVPETLSCVAGYMSSDGEVDLSRVVDWLHDKQVSVVVPYVRDQEMRFAFVLADQKFVVGQWGISIPDPIDEVHLPDIELFLVPVVAFSSRGDRLGRGGGYYDRVLSGIAGASIVGIAYEFQLDDNIQANSRDVPLDAVVTDRGWRFFNSKTDRILRRV